MEETNEKMLAPEEIPSPYAKRWYDIGFLFAVNYIYAVMPDSSQAQDSDFNQENFKLFIDQFIGEGVIDPQYIENHSFYEDNSNYGAGLCPGDLPNTCIPCMTKQIRPVPRKP